SRFCKDSWAMVYVRGLPDEYENHGHVEGRKPLVQQLDSGSQVKVRESFAFQGDQDRLSDYCRADAELCEELVKLDRANQGKGLCGAAVRRAAVPNLSRAEAMARCASLPRKDVVCVQLSDSAGATSRCDRAIRLALSV